jgi:hypothetical protein
MAGFNGDHRVDVLEKKYLKLFFENVVAVYQNDSLEFANTFFRSLVPSHSESFDVI